MVSKKKPRVMYFPTLDYLTPYQQEKKLKELAGEVKLYNMYDNIKEIPTIEEIEKMSKEKGKELVESLREKHNNTQLRDQWGITQHFYYKKFLPSLGIVLSKNKTSDNKDSKKDITQDNIQNQKTPLYHIEAVKRIPSFQIKLNGVFDGEEVSTRLLQITDLFSKDSKYNITLIVEEIE